MTYEATLEYLYQTLPMFQRVGNAAIKKGLDNTLALCEALGNPHHQFRAVHIAGTNGKGSTSHALASVLQAAGYRTGLYTSPHLKNFTERIRIDGQEIDQAFIVEFVATHKSLLERIQPSFFETTVAMAFAAFAAHQIEVAVVEVGLGGRLDSTNVLTPDLSVITNISWDHADLLGDTLPAIAREKAGIIKPGVPVVVSEYQDEVAEVFREEAGHRGAPLAFGSDVYHVTPLSQTLDGQTFRVESGDETVYESLFLDLPGRYQRQNLPGILLALELLCEEDYQISDEAILTGLSQIRASTGLKGRWQVLASSPLTICDVGHNEGGFRQIVAQLQALSYAQLYWVLGVVKEKDLTKILPLLPPTAFYLFTQPSVARALPASELAQAAQAHGLRGETVPEVNAALARARQLASPKDVIFVGGSTFVVADLDEL
ncbi:dihydrofolate synthase / folylpolyglutamate synthase [Catalinimonas alkaloidigena]|uniref:Dihydrofolate synthase/folylpolyglutamate synthase n=1 Tax=Catalinimonas alkaloidigena TaxID=1075417 RepID=A0A1G9S401_9BACT|nr:Mur ligase family protein [Catalinimonas alkaloidigena]SDM30134.1 dihydrofolate synthase / folylpolyglutamate synthase [Catalinimonas alkaloidigena]